MMAVHEGHADADSPAELVSVWWVSVYKLKVI